MPQFNVPLLGKTQQQAQAGIAQIVNQLSLQLYSKLAEQYIGTLDNHETLDPQQLQSIAIDCHNAARAYFEGIGAIPTTDA